MNALQQDIIGTIRKHGASRTVEICEDLMPLGYGGTMSFDDFKSYITKTISKMKSEGHVIGEDRPTPGSKPVRYWSLPKECNGVNHVKLTPTATIIQQRLVLPSGEYIDDDQFDDPAEMASDVVDAEQAPKPSPLLDYLIAEAEQSPAVDVEFKAKTGHFPMTITDALMLFGRKDLEGQYMSAFLQGIAAAERHHGIAE